MELCPLGAKGSEELCKLIRGFFFNLLPTYLLAADEPNKGHDDEPQAQLSWCFGAL